MTVAGHAERVLATGTVNVQAYLHTGHASLADVSKFSLNTALQVARDMTRRVFALPPMRLTLLCAPQPAGNAVGARLGDHGDAHEDDLTVAQLEEVCGRDLVRTLLLIPECTMFAVLDGVG